MPRITNYKRERANRAEAKAAKREAKRQAKAAKAASDRVGAERDSSESAENQRAGDKDDDDPGPQIET